MDKPKDRFNPKCDNPWALMECWGRQSWFPCDEEEEHGNGTKPSERSTERKPSGDKL